MTETTETNSASKMDNNKSNSSSNSPATMADLDHRSNRVWMVSFAATMVPFVAFCYGHGRGMTGRAVSAIAKSPVGVYGLLALPFGTLAMEKCIYDTVQSAQGFDPNVRPADRGGFPSGGAMLPSFSLIPVQREDLVAKFLGISQQR